MKFGYEGNMCSIINNSQFTTVKTKIKQIWKIFQCTHYYKYRKNKVRIFKSNNVFSFSPSLLEK